MRHHVHKWPSPHVAGCAEKLQAGYIQSLFPDCISQLLQKFLRLDWIVENFNITGRRGRAVGGQQWARCTAEMVEIW